MRGARPGRRPPPPAAAFEIWLRLQNSEADGNVRHTMSRIAGHGSGLL